MAEPQRVVIPYEPRPQQLKIHEALDQNRFAVAVAHRRLGKTVAAVNQLIKKAILCERQRPRYGYIAPTYRQGKAVAWDYLKYFTAPIPGVEVNESELRVDFLGRQIRIYGADNPDSMRGLYFDGVVPDEVGLMPAKTWPEVLRPALADREGWALFLGTPNGKNHFYDLAQLAKKGNGWAYLEFKASDTEILVKTELEEARRSMTADEYAQEFECSFEASVRGAIYSEELRRAREGKRICRVPYDRMGLVSTFWDLGVGDSTAIWFAQMINREVRLIDYYENSGVGLDHYVGILKTRGYSYGQHVAPHDIEARELTTGRSRKEAAQQLGINFEVCPNLRIEDGINAARLIFDRCWFDEEKTVQGREALMNYRWDYNQRIDEYKPVPVHDWASHGADAFRIMALTVKKIDIKPAKINYPKLGVV